MKRDRTTLLTVEEKYDLLDTITDFLEATPEYECQDIMKSDILLFQNIFNSKRADIKVLLSESINNYEVIPPNKTEELLQELYVARQALLIGIDTFNLGLVFYKYNSNEDYTALIPENIKQDISSANLTTDAFVRMCYDFLNEGAPYSSELAMELYDEEINLDAILDKCDNKATADILVSFIHNFDLETLNDYEVITEDSLLSAFK